MKAIKELRNRRAVSPVIATVIIVAVTITVAVAVSYWISGISSQYTAFEKIEIQSGYTETLELTPFIPGVAVDDPLTPLIDETLDIPATYAWTITLELKNSGTSTATLISVFINDKPIDQLNILCPQINPDLVVPAKLSIESGVSVTVLITIDDVAAVTYSSGTTLNVKLHSAAGMDYIRLVQLS